MLVKEKVKNREKFTPTENQISDYILEHPREVIDMSLDQLAAKLYVSKSTIIRFCKKLGFRGHKELCVQLAKETNSFLVDDGSLSFQNRIRKGDTVASAAQKILAMNYQLLTDTYNDLDLKAVEKAAELIAQYRKVRLYGIGSERSNLFDFGSRLEHIGMDVGYNLGSDNELDRAAKQETDRVAVIACYQGKARLLGQLARILSKRHIPVIMIIGPSFGSLSKYAAVALHTAYMEDPMFEGSGTNIGMQMVIDTLYAAVFLHDYDKNSEIIRSGEELIRTTE